MDQSKLAEIRKRVAERDDTNAMNSACGEYNCPCHYDLPELLALIVELDNELARTSWQVEV